MVGVHCFFCGLAGEPAGQCKRCLTAMPDPRVDVALTTPCPRCRSPLLALPFDGGAKIHPCATCGGLFVPALAWCSLIDRPHLVAVLEKRIPPAKMSATALVGMVRCASCNEEMERGRFAASSPIVVDVCTRHGVWLDARELREVVDFIAKRARGETPVEQAGPGGHTFRRGERVIIVRAGPERPPASLGSRILRSVLVTVALGIAVRLGFYWYAKNHAATAGGVDIEQQGQQSAESVNEANKALSK